MSTAPAPKFNPYALAVGEAGERRLRALQQLLAASTEQLLNAGGIGPGMRVADLGCGIGSVTEMIAQRIGASGSVTGLDCAAEQVERAKAKLEAAGLSNFEFVQAGVPDTGLPAASFDAVFFRLLLIHIPAAEAALAEMARILKPGGMLVCEDLEIASLCSEPPSAVDRVGPIFTQMGPLLGVDWNRGRRLNHLLRANGWTITHTAIAQQWIVSGETKRIPEWSLVETAQRLIENNVITPDELDALLAELRSIADDDNVLVMMPRMHQVCAIRPK